MRSTTAAAIFGIVIGLAPGISTAAPAAGTDVGIGFVLGNPSGLSAKLPAGPVNAFQFILAYDANPNRNWNNRGWSGTNCEVNNDCNSRLYLGGDYVWHNYDVIPVRQGRLPLYYGPGLWTAIADNAAVGIRFVLGLEYQFAKAPFDVFLEIAPGVRVIPNTAGYVSSGLGARFFF